MQIQPVNHCKIGQHFQGQEAILFFHYAGSLLLNLLRKKNIFLGENKKRIEVSGNIGTGEMLLETFAAPGGMGAGTPWVVPKAFLGWMMARI